MKLNQKIKAINEGIRKSLLSFDDVEFEQSTGSNQKVSKSIKDWQWIQENFVDLELPSGSLWCKWNIGATNGDTSESWYGDYYAWGETEIKSKYTLKDYTYKENLEILPDEKDIAYLTDKRMHMPTKEQILELKSLPNKWVTNYNGITSLNGRVFTGKNGKELFIPSAGYYNGCNVGDGNSCFLWTRSLYTNDQNRAQGLYFNPYDISIDSNSRYVGLSVRGVVNKL